MSDRIILLLTPETLHAFVVCYYVIPHVPYNNSKQKGNIIYIIYIIYIYTIYIYIYIYIWCFKLYFTTFFI